MSATTTRRRQRIVVCEQAELPPGQTRLYTAGHRQIVVAHLPEQGYVALSNYCAHQGGPLSAGKMERMWVGDKPGETRQDPQRWVLICPFHNFEIDARSGCPVAKLGRHRNATYEVTVEDGSVVVYV